MSTPPSVPVPWRFVEKPDGADAVLWQQGLEAAHSGRLYLAERDFAQARKSFEQALDIFLRAGDKREAAVCKGSLGDIAFFEGRVFEAIELHEEACATARGIADTYVEALALRKAGAIYGLLGDREIQRSYWRRAASISGEVAQMLEADGESATSEIAGSQAPDAESGKRVTSAGASAANRAMEGEEVHRTSPPSHDPDAAGGVLSAQSRSRARSERAAMRRSDRQHSREQTAKTTAQSQGDANSDPDGMLASADDLTQSSDPGIQLLACVWKGEELRTRSDFAAAIREYSKAFEHALLLDHERQKEEEPLVLMARLGRAECYLHLGEPGKSRPDAETVFRSLPTSAPPEGRTEADRAAAWEDELLFARTCQILGCAELLLGRIEEAEATIRQGLEICLSWQGLPMPKHVMRECLSAVGICAHSLGNLYSDTDRPEEALKQLEMARNAFEAAEDTSSLASIHLDIANALTGTWRRDALQALSAAKISTPNGEIAVEIQNHYIAARDLYRQAKDLQGEAQVSGFTARFLLNAGQPAQAQAWLQEASRLHAITGDQQGLAMDRLNEGIAYRRLGLDRIARETFAEALHLARDFQLPELEWQAQANLGTLAKELAEARNHLEAAAAVIESQRSLIKTESYKARFFGDNEEAVYQHLTRTYLSLGERKLAFWTVERSRSRALLDLLRDTALRPDGNVPRSWLDEEVELMQHSRIARRALEAAPTAQGGLKRKLLDEVATARQSLESLFDRLSVVAPEYVALRRGNPVTFDDAQRLVQEQRRVVLIEYFTMGNSVLVFGISPESERPDVMELPLNEPELRRFVRSTFGAHERVRELIADGLEGIWHAYDYLLQPVARWTSREDIVYLIPHGLLHYFPLHALKVDSLYLIERNPVAYATSASALKFCQVKRKPTIDGGPSQLGAAVFGDPQGDLPHARREAEAVAAVFKMCPLLGDNVTRSTLDPTNNPNVARASVIHFAGHGYFDSDDPLNSGLRLAGGDVLTARDIFNLNASLDAELVTLSGCETGVSEHHSGDELLGLTRALLYAGAPSLLVSLWRVADDSTEALMTSFYGRIRAGKSSLAKVATIDALREAVLETKSDYPSFDRWAPFRLVGDWQ